MKAKVITQIHKTILCSLPPGGFELDLQLVAFDLDDFALAEFLVEDARLNHPALQRTIPTLRQRPSDGIHTPP